jgi:hypothetical protein
MPWGFHNKKNKDIAADCQQLFPDHTATNCKTLQNLLRILKETGFFPLVKAQSGHPRLVEDMFWEQGSEAHALKVYTELKSNIAFTQVWSIVQRDVSIRTTKHFAAGLSQPCILL